MAHTSPSSPSRASRPPRPAPRPLPRPRAPLPRVASPGRYTDDGASASTPSRTRSARSCALRVGSDRSEAESEWRAGERSRGRSARCVAASFQIRSRVSTSGDRTERAGDAQSASYSIDRSGLTSSRCSGSSQNELGGSTGQWSDLSRFVGRPSVLLQLLGVGVALAAAGAALGLDGADELQVEDLCSLKQESEQLQIREVSGADGWGAEDLLVKVVDGALVLGRRRAALRALCLLHRMVASV